MKIVLKAGQKGGFLSQTQSIVKPGDVIDLPYDEALLLIKAGEFVADGDPDASVAGKLPEPEPEESLETPSPENIDPSLN